MSKKQRIKSYTKRMDALDDRNTAFYSLHNNPNIELWINELAELSEEQAEVLISQLESADIENKTSPAKIKRDWADNLRKDRLENDISPELLLEALVRGVILGDSAMIDELKGKLEESDSRNPRL